MRRPVVLPQEINLPDLVRDIQSALDRAEAAHRMALAAHRQAGDKLLELSNALRSRATHGVSRDQKFDEPIRPQITPIIASMTASEPLLVTIREASRLTSLSRSSIYRYLGEGSFEVRRTGRRTMIVYASLKSWVEGLTAQHIDLPR